MGSLWTVILASQRYTCAVNQTECYVSIPEESANVWSLANYMRARVNALSDLTPSLEDLINQWLGSWGC